MKNFKYLKAFEAFTPPPPPVDSMEYVIQQQNQDLTRKDTFKLSNISKYVKGSTEKTLDTLKSLNLVQGKLYGCVFDDDLTGEVFVSKGNRHHIDFRDLQDDVKKYIQLNNLENRFKLRIFDSIILKELHPDKFGDIKDGTVFLSFEPQEEGSYVIYITSDGVSHLTNIPDKLEFNGQ